MRVKRVVIVYRPCVAIDRPLGLWKEHTETLRKVKQTLSENGIEWRVIKREAFRGTARAELVITVGGDGTFLSASHHLKKTPILCVNATPRHSVAFFAGTTAKEFPHTLDRLIRGDLRARPIFRLEVHINGKRLKQPALNEILFCHPSPAGTARYILKVGRRVEEHRSSGVLVGSAAGSRALIHSAGGRRLPLGSKKIQLVVREPYEPPGQHYKLIKDILPANARIQIRSRLAKGVLFIDGSHISVPVRFGDRIDVKRSPTPLWIIR